MPELQILSNWWYLFGLPFIILTLVLVFVLFQSSSKKRAIAELTGQTTTSKSSSWINWKLILAGVIVGSLAYLYFFTGSPGWIQNLGFEDWSLRGIQGTLEAFAKDFGESWHPWGASFWQAMAVFVLWYVMLEFVKEEGAIYWLATALMTFYLIIAVASWILVWIGGKMGIL